MKKVKPIITLDDFLKNDLILKKILPKKSKAQKINDLTRLKENEEKRNKH
jgi:hypothetical protein